MHVNGLRMKLIVAGVALAWLAGCQTTEKQRNTPGALPTAEVKDATPRLNASTYFAHAHLLERQGNLDQAVEQYRQALALAPKFASARNRLAITLNKLGQNAQATAEFKLATAETPNDAYLHNNLGFSLYLEGKYEEAIAALDRAIEIKPQFQRAHMNRGITLARLGRFDEALCEFTLSSGPADAHYNLALIQTEMGQYAAAAKSLETVLQVDANHEAARQQLRVVSRLVAEVDDVTTNQVQVADVTPPPAPAPASPPEIALPGEVGLASDVQIENSPESQPSSPTEAPDAETIGTFPPPPGLPDQEQTPALNSTDLPAGGENNAAIGFSGRAREFHAKVTALGRIAFSQVREIGRALLVDPGALSVEGQAQP